MPARFYPDAPLPRHLEQWERLDLHNSTAHLVDEPWRHFEPFLASRGYTLCWKYYSRERPPIRTRALNYPVAEDPFRPRSSEGFVHLCDSDGDSNHGGIHQTTGWLTQVSELFTSGANSECQTQTASLKMAYDTQERVVTNVRCI
jgi:hypothetical protein